MPFLNNNNRRTYYLWEPAIYEDKADTIVMIHTNISDLTIYESMVPFLNKDFNVVRYDLRGLGLSDLGNDEFSIDLFVSDLFFLIESLNLGAVHLIGFGFGGLIALKFSLLHTKMVKKMVLMTLSCFPEKDYADVKRHRDKISFNGSKIPVDSLIKKATQIDIGDNEYQRIHEMISKTPLSVYNRIMELTVYTNPIPYMEKTKIQTLILSGENEALFPQNLLAINAIYLPNFQYAVIPNASSFLMIDQPEITAKMSHEFLSPLKHQMYTKDNLANSIYEKVRIYTQDVYKQGIKNAQTSNHIEIDLLYSFHVRINHRTIVKGWNQRYAKQILIHLLFHQTTTREQLCETLWPLMDLRLAKKNLRVYLTHLKKLVNTDPLKPVIVSDREHIYLNGEVSSDVLSFITEMHQALNETNEKIKYHKTNKVVGQLAAGYLMVIYDDWFLKVRNKLENDLVSLIIWMGNWLSINGELQEAVRHLTNALTIFEDNEKIYDLLIEIYTQIPDIKKREFWIKKKEEVWGLT